MLNKITQMPPFFSKQPTIFLLIKIYKHATKSARAVQKNGKKIEQKSIYMIDLLVKKLK